MSTREEALDVIKELLEEIYNIPGNDDIDSWEGINSDVVARAEALLESEGQPMVYGESPVSEDAENVVINESDGMFSIYNEAGQSIEVDFETRLDAEVWAEDNGYEVVDSFFTPVHSTRQDYGEPWQDPQPDKEF